MYQLSKWKQPNLLGSQFDRGHLDRPDRCLFSCSNSPSISKISEISNQKRGFLISGTPFWCSNSSPRVYSDSERGKTRSSSKEPQNSSVSGRLASSVTHERTMSHRFSKLGKIGARIRPAHQFSKVGIGTHAKTGFSGLSLQSSKGSSLSNPKEANKILKNVL